MKHLIWIVLALFVGSAWAVSLPPTQVTIFYDFTSQLLILRWPAVAGATSYHVYRANSTAGPFDTSIADVATETYSDPIDPIVNAKAFYIITADDGMESAFSNHVGYAKVNCLGGVGTVATPFGIPFQTWNVLDGVPTYGVNSSCPSDIFGEQLSCGTSVTADRIVGQSNNQFAYRNSAYSCDWYDQLEFNCGTVPGGAYTYENNSGVDRDIVLFGEVNNSDSYASTTMLEGAWSSNPVSWRDSRSLHRSQLDLLASGFTGGTLTTSDRVIDQISGAFFYYPSGAGSWAGALHSIEPGRAYWIWNKDHANNDWTYNFNPTGCFSESVSGTWNASISPLYVCNDITVPSGQTLTIEPGVVVRFSGDYKFNVQGTLVAVGTAQDSIKFTCDTLANPNKWAGIRFLNTGNNNSILQYCVIENGRADGATADDRVGGGVYALYSDITLRNCTIRNCSAQVHGGALWAAHHLIRIEDCIFENNSCQSAGGAVRLDQGAYSILRTSFLNNHATDDIGGGLYVESASGSPQEVRNCTFTGNTSLHDGGAMYLYNANIVVDSCNVAGNNAGGSGGGLYAYNVGGSVSHSTFDHDSANGEAGAVAFLFSTASFTDCNFLHNRAASIGAFWCSASTPALTRCTFDHNQATGTVGAFYCNAPTNAELSECIFTNNSAGSDGGACYLDGGTPSFDYCTFSQNSSGGDGGAIMSEGCDAVITRGLFAENNTAGEGAAVYMVNSGGSINHSTLASNTGSVALWVQSSQPAISNCVVRSDFNGGTFEIEYSPNASIHHCCFSGGSQGVVCPCPPDFWTGWTTNSNGDDCDASFNLFAYNPLFVDEVGGNYNLACGSPCIDAGDPLSAPDPDGTVVDMGYLYHPHSSIIPSAPEQLVIRRDTPTTDLKLYWSPVTHDVNNVPIVVCGYEIERSLTADFASFTILGSSSDTTYTDAVSVPSQMNAFYRVKAVME
ncbi:right-handed parallel beta-helix repeat-containing protein [bacterium]|nr:right-handed parallel beta-helix repeat-containing protein [bacterium]